METEKKKTYIVNFKYDLIRSKDGWIKSNDTVKASRVIKAINEMKAVEEARKEKSKKWVFDIQSFELLDVHLV